MTARERYGFHIYHVCGGLYKHRNSDVACVPIKNLVTYDGKSADSIDYLLARENAGMCMDSGAYPAFKKNKDLDVDRYIEFVKEKQDKLEWFAQMDFIPRAVGGKQSDLQTYASEKTWERYIKMHETEGVNEDNLAFILHSQSSIEGDLRRALEWRSEVTGKGVQMVACGLSFPDKFLRTYQLDLIGRLFKEYGYEGRFHALGLLDKEIYENYKFITSADSSSIVHNAISGQIMIDGKMYKILDDEKVSHRSKFSPKLRELEKEFLIENCKKYGRDFEKASKKEGYVERFIWGCLEANNYFYPEGYKPYQQIKQ